ncbi:MAG: hypothetical protein KAK00_06810 [Nanoarchaeota archaeon]|nr:hypothetical protein [Nanoarchaeota archaeon]
MISPANLKFGFDFRIDVDRMAFRKRIQAPIHTGIFEDLKENFSKDKDYCDKVIQAITDVNNIIEPEEILKDFEDENIGFSVELLLKASKWLAVEQDIRYWNGWDRNKQALWIRLREYFEFNYAPIKQGFKFYNQEGKLLTEEEAVKVLGGNS